MLIFYGLLTSYEKNNVVVMFSIFSLELFKDEFYNKPSSFKIGNIVNNDKSNKPSIYIYTFN